MRNHEAVQRVREHARSSYVGFRLAAVALLLVVLASASTSRLGAGSPSAAPAPPSLRSASAAQNAAASSSVTVAKPTGVTSGDVLVAAVTARVDAGSALTQPSGWTLVRRDDCSGPERTVLAQALFYKVATGSEPSSYAFSFPVSTGAAGSVLAYAGVNTATPVDGSSGRYSRNTVFTHGPSVTPSGEGRRLVASFAHSGAQNVTPPSGSTQRAVSMVSATPTATMTVVDEALASSAASGNKVAKASTPQACNVGGMVLLTPSGATSTNPPPPASASRRLPLRLLPLRLRLHLRLPPLPLRLRLHRLRLHHLRLHHRRRRARSPASSRIAASGTSRGRTARAARSSASRTSSSAATGRSPSTARSRSSSSGTSPATRTSVTRAISTSCPGAAATGTRTPST